MIINYSFVNTNSVQYPESKLDLKSQISSVEFSFKITVFGGIEFFATFGIEIIFKKSDFLCYLLLEIMVFGEIDFFFRTHPYSSLCSADWMC